MFLSDGASLAAGSCDDTLERVRQGEITLIMSEAHQGLIGHSIAPGYRNTGLLEDLTRVRIKGENWAD